MTSNKALITGLTAAVLAISVLVLAYMVLHANNPGGVTPNGQKVGDGGSPYTNSNTPSMDSRTGKPMDPGTSTMDRDRGLNAAPMNPATQDMSSGQGSTGAADRDGGLSTSQTGQSTPRDRSGGTGTIGSGQSGDTSSANAGTSSMGTGSGR